MSGPRSRTTALPLALLSALLLATNGRPAAATDWAPISVQDRSLASLDPNGPGAIILFEEAEVDDRHPEGRLQTLYRRVKILLDSGSSWGTLSIRLEAASEQIVELEGRTVTADGKEELLNRGDVTRSVTADGRTQVVYRLPDAVPGSIIEYRYAILGGAVPPVGGWIFQHEVPCRRSSFIWHPSLARTSRWVLLKAEEFDPLLEPLFRPDAPESLDAARFEIKNLPPDLPEAWGPPAIETLARVVTLYDAANLTATEWWRSFAAGSKAHEKAFAADQPRLARELAALAPLPDDPSARIRRLYDWVQGRIRNLSLTPNAPPTIATADSLLALGEGSGESINLLFVAALEASGIPATRAFVVDRDRAFFHSDVVTSSQFHRSLVVVTPGESRAWFFAPGSPFAPPGLIPWYAQGITAVAAADSGAMFVPTPIDPPDVNRTDRLLTLRLDPTGRADGTITVDLAGQPELEARQILGAGGSGALRSQLETDWKASLASVAVESLATAHADDPSRNLSVRAAIGIPGFGRRVGAELLVNGALVARLDRNPLGEPGTIRRQPLLARWPSITHDDVSITLPPEWVVSTLPDPVTFQNEFGSYEARWFSDGEHLNYQRTLVLAAARLDPPQVPALRDLLDQVVNADAALVPLEWHPIRPSKR